MIGGPVGDRIGRRRVILWSILGVLPFSLALPYVDLLWTRVLSMVIGLILASAFSAIIVYAQELVPGRVGTISGLFFGFAFGIAGIGAAVLGELADRTSLALVFQVCSYLPVIGSPRLLAAATRTTHCITTKTRRHEARRADAGSRRAYTAHSDQRRARPRVRVLHGCGPAGQSAKSWLDRPLTNWNKPAKAVPRGMPADESIAEMAIRCDLRVRRGTAAEGTLADNGWLPFLHVDREIIQGDVEIVGGMADADGMCRPVKFNVFVFVGGQLAGTLSPVLMSSRTDGSIGAVRLAADDTIAAEFARYTDRGRPVLPLRPRERSISHRPQRTHRVS